MYFVTDMSSDTSSSSLLLLQVFSPPRDNQYGNAVFPGIIDMINLAEEDPIAWADVQHEVWRVARAFERVAMVLQGSLL